MKNVNYIINGVLAVAVIILFVLHFTGNKSQAGGAGKLSFENALSGAGLENGIPEGMMPVAYVNIDSLLMNYNYAVDLNEMIIKKQENARANIGQKVQALQKELDDFQRKIETNAFLTTQRAESEQNRLIKKRQDLEEEDNRVAAELYNEQQQISEQLRENIVEQLRVFNQSYGFQIILSNTSGDNILIADNVYDITAAFLEHLNKSYSSPAK